MTNNEFFKMVYKPYQETHMTTKTCYTRCMIIENRLLQGHGEESPSAITNLTIEKIYDDMEERNYAQNTIFGTYAALYSFFRMATEYTDFPSFFIS